MFDEFLHNFTHNLFKPLLLFFYMGFAIPLLRIQFEFPRALYQAITMYLLVAIGWHGGEELAAISRQQLVQAAGFMALGFVTNTVIGFVAYYVLSRFTALRKIDAATIAGYYGSDSAGTFVTCVGVLTATGIAYAAYMPVMLAVMEIPGCLVALYLVSRMRRQHMDREGNMPGEHGYQAHKKKRNAAEEEVVIAQHAVHHRGHAEGGHDEDMGGAVAVATRPNYRINDAPHHGGHGQAEGGGHSAEPDAAPEANPNHSFGQLLHEVFFNPGLYLLFGGILIGFISRLQGVDVVKGNDELFLKLFGGILCLFLLEMGITACQRLKDLRKGGWQFVAFALVGPNVFACTGILLAHAYSHIIGQPFEIGTYVLFAVLCGAASYIAVPAVQRLAIPEASPTLPLAASLGITFTYNVTIGIPVYLEVAKLIAGSWPVVA